MQPHQFNPSFTTQTGFEGFCAVCGLAKAEGQHSTRTQPRAIQQVVIHRAEGVHNLTSSRVRFTGPSAEQSGDRWLREIAKTAPADGGCHKTDVWVTLSTGQEYRFRFDVRHTSLPGNDTSIREHLREWFLLFCRPQELPHIAANPTRLAEMWAKNTPEEKVKAELVIALLDQDKLP